jgi:hypothetical protein
LLLVQQVVLVDVCDGVCRNRAVESPLMQSIACAGRKKSTGQSIIESK